MIIEDLKNNFYYVGLAPYNKKTVAIFKNKENFDYYVSYTENVLNPLSEQEKENFLSSYLPDENIIPEMQVLSKEDNNYSACYVFPEENSSAMLVSNDGLHVAPPRPPKKSNINFDFKIFSELEGTENEETISKIKQAFASGVEKNVNLMKKIGLPEEKIKECVSKFKNDFKIQIKKENDPFGIAFFDSFENAIRLHPSSFRDKSISNIEQTFCHELMHFSSSSIGIRTSSGGFSALDEAITEYLASKAVNQNVKAYKFETDLLFKFFPSKEIPNDFLNCYFNNEPLKALQLLSNYTKINDSLLTDILFVTDHRLNLVMMKSKSDQSKRHEFDACIQYSEKYIDVLFETNKFLKNDSKFNLSDLKKFNNLVDDFKQFHKNLLNYDGDIIAQNVDKNWINNVYFGYYDSIDQTIENYINSQRQLNKDFSKENVDYSSLKFCIDALVNEEHVQLESNEFYNRFLKIVYRDPSFILKNLTSIEKDYPQFSGISEIKNELYSEILKNKTIEIDENAFKAIIKDKIFIDKLNDCETVKRLPDNILTYLNNLSAETKYEAFKDTYHLDKVLNNKDDLKLFMQESLVSNYALSIKEKVIFDLIDKNVKSEIINDIFNSPDSGEIDCAPEPLKKLSPLPDKESAVSVFKFMVSNGCLNFYSFDEFKEIFDGYITDENKFFNSLARNMLGDKYDEHKDEIVESLLEGNYDASFDVCKKCFVKEYFDSKGRNYDEQKLNNLQNYLNGKEIEL